MTSVIGSLAKTRAQKAMRNMGSWGGYQLMLFNCMQFMIGSLAKTRAQKAMRSMGSWGGYQNILIV
jgi:hypothetical protein